MDILEAIYLHSVACHPGDQQLKLSVSTDVLVGCPISVNAVENMSLLRDKCPNCEMGKAVRKRFGSRRSYSKADKTREMPSSVHPITQSYGPNGEILSVDLWFMDSVTFMITKGMLKRYTHIRLLKGRDKKSVFGGIRAILDDYKRNRLVVASVFNTQDEGAVEILDLTSDNEGAFISAGLELLPKYNVDIQVVPSGDHIKMVERPIRDIKARMRSKMSEFNWLLPTTLIPWLAVNVVNWINLLRPKGHLKSPWVTVKGFAPNYKDVTRTNFGDPIVCYRSVLQLVQGQARGEPGLSLGVNPGVVNSILFYSFETKAVKARSRFVRITGCDLIGVYGRNKFSFHIPMVYSQNYDSWCNKRPAVSGAALPDVINSDPDISDNIPVGTPLIGPTNSDRLLSSDLNESSHPISNLISMDDKVPTPLVWPDYLSDGTPLCLFDNTDASSGVIEENNSLPLISENAEYVPDLILPDTPEYVPDDLLMSSTAEYVPETVLSDEYSLVRGVDMHSQIELDSSPVEGDDNFQRDLIIHDIVSMEDSAEIDETPPFVARTSSRVASDKYAGKSHNKFYGMNYAGIFKSKLSSDATLENVTANYGQICDVSANMGWNAGIKKWGQQAEIAIDKECLQFVDYTVFHPTKDSPSDYCRSHPLIDQKADGTIKARLVCGKTVHGSEIEYNVPLYSPVIDSKLIYMMLSLCLKHKNDLSVLDVKGAFFKAMMDANEEVYVHMEPKIAERMVRLKPEWRKFLRKDKSMMVISDKAWYGTAVASALWNKEITATLTNLCGYNQHSMCKCLFYKHVNGRLCFILLHVDDLGISMPPDGVEKDRVVRILEKKYETLKKKEGDFVIYIGLEIRRCRTTNQFYISMRERMSKLLVDNNFTKSTSTKIIFPASNSGTFTHPTDAEIEDLLPTNDITKYRSVVMTLNYLSVVYVSIKFYISWLATRQSAPSRSDWKKVLHLLKHLSSCMDDELVIGAMSDNPTIHVYTDASFDVYRDSKSHSGIAVFIDGCRAAVFCSSNKQHCLSRSSCDAEIVTCEQGTFIGSYLRDVLDELCITCTVKHHQDNESCITLVDSGTTSYDRKERHVVRRINYMHDYFRLLSNYSVLIFCPTEDMYADVLTKAYGGSLYVMMKSLLMGIAAKFAK